jgi:two-component system sensor histidine kinase/response regulator
MRTFTQKLSYVERRIRRFGYTSILSGHEKRKLGIFNLMNLSFGSTLGILIPLMVWVRGSRFPALVWCCISMGPMLISIIASAFIHFRQYERARICFFILHPLLLTWIYAMKIDIGTDLFFICYGVLSVFFLQNIYHIIFCFSLSMSCYFIAHSFGGEGVYNLETVSIDLFLFNRLLAIFFIFYGIFLIRNENDRYQLQIINTNMRLRASNGKIRMQKKELSERSVLMEEQAQQLGQLNSLKNKLFSVIAHDLRGPLHALYNLFLNMERYDLPGDEIKMLIPDVAKDLADTTGHIENLLQWAKSQMNAESVKPQILDIEKIVREVLKFLHLQVEAKKLRIESRIDKPLYVYADKEMINVVLRNLLSNAIKFTPEGGIIILGAMERLSYIEVFVQDTGAGISPDNLKKLAENIHYTTSGTANESGTGLGLMLCREFLSRNGGRLEVDSQPGKGSIFSFTLPKRT